jgi:hypothetical protein
MKLGSCGGPFLFAEVWAFSTTILIFTMRLNNGAASCLLENSLAARAKAKTHAIKTQMADITGDEVALLIIKSLYLNIKK